MRYQPEMMEQRSQTNQARRITPWPNQWNKSVVMEETVLPDIPEPVSEVQDQTDRLRPRKSIKCPKRNE
jgi:hypothetical protein